MQREQCGTYAGASAHNAHDEPLCEACRAAATEYMRYHRFVKGSQHDLTRCRICGSVFTDHRCDGPARDAQGEI